MPNADKNVQGWREAVKTTHFVDVIYGWPTVL